MRGVASAFLAVPLLCRAAERGRFVARLNVRTGAKIGGVNYDKEPTVRDFSSVAVPQHQPPSHLLNAVHFNDMRRDLNPKNGTPWFRYKKTSSKGTADHEHFNDFLGRQLTATGDFQYDILHAHNVVRENAGMEPLQWSTGLFDLANRRVQTLAHDGCYIQHSGIDDRWETAGFTYVGENLYKVINMAPTGVDIVDAWYAEIDDYSYGTVGTPCVKDKCAGRASPPCTLGHFTQVMWARTTHVGCASAECPGQEKRTFVAVCNYGPGGNVVGDIPFAPDVSAKIGLNNHGCDVPGSGKSAAAQRGVSLVLATVLTWGFVH